MYCVRPSLHGATSRWLAVMLLALLPAYAQAQTFTAEAAVEKLQVYVGEPFVFQIQVKGADTPDEPTLGGLTGFNAQQLGGQQNSSQSVTIVNGRMNRTVSKGYVFNYRLTAQQPGALTIPAITVTAEGKTVRTRPVTIRVQEPSENEDFKLRVSLSDSEAYVGQPVTMTVTWYIGGNVRDFAFNLPILDDGRFDVIAFDPAVPAQSKDYLRIALGDQRAIAKKDTGDLNGRTYTTVRFQKILIPKQAGSIALPQATVSCQATGLRARRRSLLDEFFSDPMGMVTAGSETIIAPANAVSLKVNNLPAAGRPAQFSGLIGRYSIKAEAVPTDMNVGDPITLSMRISGPSYLANVELPPLQEQTSLARDFRIPQDRAPGAVQGRAKVFTQTIRATHPGLTQIPPIELSYFNPDSGTYETAKTDPIPITVKGARIITARDAEGVESSAVIQTGIETNEGGIGANYEGFDALQNQAQGIAAWLRSPLWTAFIFLPPLTYFGLLAFMFTQRRQADPAVRKAQRAHRDLENTLDELLKTASTGDQQDAALLDALRRYLGHRLALPPGALTYTDVHQEFENRDVSQEVLDDLKAVFERCEAGRYAGGVLAGQDLAGTSRRMLEVAEKLEEQLS
ncbi:MAG: BatD family protein [Acidobacteria bacterium]|nr:BatD family protein [Acidobacteriota bacterium]